MMHSSTAMPDALRGFVDSFTMDVCQDNAGLASRIYRSRAHRREVSSYQLVHHIRANGYEGKFYRKTITYYDDGGLVYWTMGAPFEETTIINRCRKEDTYR